MSLYWSGDGIDLHKGDSLAVLASLPDNSIDGIVADPPYSSGGMTRGDRTQSTRTKYVSSDAQHEIPDFTGDSRDARAYQYWTALWLGEALRVTKTGGVAILFTDWRQLPTTTDALQSGGWVWRGVVPWVKPNSRPQAGRFAAECEYVVWGSSGSMGNDFTKECFPGFYQASAPKNREHQTQKPVDIMRSLVKIVPEGGTVLDPFMGSGTTGVAAALEGRKFIGVEQAEHFCQVAQRRIQEAQGLSVARGLQDAMEFPA